MLSKNLGEVQAFVRQEIAIDKVYQKCRSSKNLLMSSLYQPYEHGQC